MQIQEKDAEAAEAERKDKSAEFRIDDIKVHVGIKPIYGGRLLTPRNFYKDKYDYAVQASTELNNTNPSDVILEVSFKNYTPYSAYELKYYEIDTNLEEENLLNNEQQSSDGEFGIQVRKVKEIESQEKLPMWMSWRGKTVTANFCISYRNLYNYWYHQKILITYGVESNKFVCQIAYCDKEDGKEDVKPSWSEEG